MLTLLLPLLAMLVAQPAWAAAPGDPTEPPTTLPRAATDAGVPAARMPTVPHPAPGATVPTIPPPAPGDGTSVPGNPMPGPGTPFPGTDHPTPGGGAVP